MTSYAVSMIRSGRTFDIECGRSSHRLQTTWRILESLGLVEESLHSDNMAEKYDYANPGSLTMTNGTPVHRCDWLCCIKPLKPFVTDEMIQQAWNLGSTMITERAAWMRRPAKVA